MTASQNISIFLSRYSEDVIHNAMALRKLILNILPGVKEQIDIPAKMIAYSYGQRYSDMVCTLIPSQKGLKLGFYKGPDLPDPEKLLQGKGKISRYVEIKKPEDLKMAALSQLLHEAFKAYSIRSKQ